MNDKDLPDGWDYNPSAWQQRTPVLILALSGFCVMLYLSLFQMQILTRGDQPFAPGASDFFVTSTIFSLQPIPDALVGAAAYLVAALTCLLGGASRWRNCCTLVLVNGLAVGPLGGISLLLMISQPLRLDAWSVFCFVSALISILMIGPVLDEVLATLQSLKERSRGRSLSGR